MEMNVSSVAHTSGVWATEETFISNTISFAVKHQLYSTCRGQSIGNVGRYSIVVAWSAAYFLELNGIVFEIGRAFVSVNGISSKVSGMSISIGYQDDIV